jgi:hypothetical protein
MARILHKVHARRPPVRIEYLHDRNTGMGNSLYNSVPECESPEFMPDAWLIGALSKLSITNRRIGIKDTEPGFGLHRNTYSR